MIHLPLRLFPIAFAKGDGWRQMSMAISLLSRYFLV
jgi:hypothetical protein